MVAPYQLMLLVLGLAVAILQLPVPPPMLLWSERQLPAPCEREPLRVLGDIRGLVRTLGDADLRTFVFEADVVALAPRECAGPTRIRLYQRDAGGLAAGGNGSFDRSTEPARASPLADRLLPGTRLHMDVRLKRPWGRVNPFAARGERDFLVAGIHAVGSLVSFRVVPPPVAPALSVAARLDRLREYLSRSIREQVQGDVGGLLAALAVGDRRFITAGAWERLRLYGLTHLMVISGMHVTLLALPGWWLGSALSRLLSLRAASRGASAGGRRLPMACALLFAGSYSMLSGFALPTQRAVLMLCIGMLPGLFGRSLDAARGLPIVVLLLLLANPLSVLSASFWLTVGAVALLLWSTCWRSDRGGLYNAGAAQLYMLLAMLPLGLFWFQSASTIGGVVNFVAIPLTTLGVVPFLLLSLLVQPLAPASGDALLAFAAGLLSLLWSAMVYWEDWLRHWGVLSAAPSRLLLLAGFTAILLLALPAFRWRPLIIALGLVPLFFGDHREAAEELDLWFLDMGQGTAVFLTQGKVSLLYDTGGGVPDGPPIAKRSLLPLLRGLGVDALDVLVISHPDQDHAAGEHAVRQVAPPVEIRRGVAEVGDAERCRLGETRSFGGEVTLQVLSQATPGDSDNNASCVLMVSAYGRRILLPGDIDSRRERELVAYWGTGIRADVLLAAHHGSGSSSSRLWLRSVDPELVIVTAGRANRFGHPAQRVVEAVSKRNVPLLNTAERGAIRVRISPDGSMQCRIMRHRWQPFWRGSRFSRDCWPPREASDGYNQPDRQEEFDSAGTDNRRRMVDGHHHHLLGRSHSDMH